jgi:hypothetical protein
LTARSARHVEDDLAFCAVCIVGTARKVPRDFGDNEGAQPLRIVVTTGNPQHAPRVFNRGVHSPGFVYVLHAYVYVRTEEHGNRLKDAMEKSMDSYTETMLHGWEDGEPWMLELLLGQAVEELGYDVWDEQGKQDYIARAAKRRR